MTIFAEATFPAPLYLDFSTVKLTDEQFYQLCIKNAERKLELTAKGVLIIMAPVGGESGNREADLITDLNNWNRRTQLGKVFSSSTIFKLPDGSQRSPDAAWVERSRWESLTLEQRKKFPPLAPDFVIELRSETDRRADLHTKMEEYRANGVRLGWSIDPQERQVAIYRIDKPVEVLQSPISISGEDVLSGFTLDVNQLW